MKSVICVCCKEELLETEEYFPISTTNRSGYKGNCRICEYAKHLIRYHKRGDELRKKRRDRTKCPKKWFQKWTSVIKTNYNITPKNVAAMLDKQRGCCDICGKTLVDKDTPYYSIDHCHTTGKVRGILCSQCNTALGLMYDNIEFLQSAIRYLQKNN